MRDFETFAAEAAEQGVQLPSSVEAAAANPQLLGEYCYAPTAMLAAIAAVGHMVRRNPGAGLIGRQLSLERFGGMLPSTLATMLNASKEPVVDDTLPTFSFGREIYPISACDSADKRLGSVARFAAMEGQSSVAHAQIITHQGVPVIMRKGSPGHTSAMNIRPILLNGIPTPPGTILRVSTVHDYPTHIAEPPDPMLESRLPPVYLRGEEFPGRFVQCDIRDVTEVSFSRLSSYALPPGERTQIMFPGSDIAHMQFDHELYIHLRWATIQQIAEGIDASLPHAVPLKKI